MPCKIWCARACYFSTQSKHEIVQLIRDVNNLPDEPPFINVNLDSGNQAVLSINHISAITPA